jgi:hypothetical protein
MHDHPGRVQDAAQTRTPHGRQLGERPLDEVAGLAAGPDLVPCPLQRRTRRRQRKRPRLARKALVPEQQVD